MISNNEDVAVLEESKDEDQRPRSESSSELHENRTKLYLYAIDSNDIDPKFTEDWVKKAFDLTFKCRGGVDPEHLLTSDKGFRHSQKSNIVFVQPR